MIRGIDFPTGSPYAERMMTKPNFNKSYYALLT